MRRGDYVEYGGRTSKTIPAGTTVRVACEATSQKTVVEALGRDGVVVRLVLANKYLRVARGLF